MPLSPGSQAPDFTLKSSAEGFPEVRLGDNFGKRPTVLLFFPATYSPPCTEEICGLAKQAVPEFGDAAVYGISVDSPFSQAAWSKQESIGFPLLSDMGRTVSHAYDVVLSNFLGTGGEASARAVYVIDREGKITYAAQTPKATDMPDFEAVREAVAVAG